jgi:hypothetical protein
MLALCHVSMSFSCFMIILGTIERYLITVKSQYLECFRRSRLRFAFILLCFAMLLRGTAIFESKNKLNCHNYTKFLVQVTKNGNCDGAIEYEPALTVNHWSFGLITRILETRRIVALRHNFQILYSYNYDSLCTVWAT